MSDRSQEFKNKHTGKKVKQELNSVVLTNIIVTANLHQLTKPTSGWTGQPPFTCSAHGPQIGGLWAGSGQQAATWGPLLYSIMFLGEKKPYFCTSVPCKLTNIWNQCNFLSIYFHRYFWRLAAPVSYIHTVYGLYCINIHYI